MKHIYTTFVTSGITYECLGDDELGLQEGDAVVVRCERYLDNAVISAKIGDPIEDVAEFEKLRNQQNKGRHIEGQTLPVIERKVTKEDLVKIEDNKIKAKAAHEKTKERINVHGLEMKLIHTHYALDQKLILFLFSADGRIDFRELLRDLSGMFRIRVELRQIGVRDEACLLGGIGICGRPFCCSSFLSNFNSINVKMAKQQGISLNPQNISGCCGRLKCCLYYEAEAYKNTPVPCRNKQQNAQGESPAGQSPQQKEPQSRDNQQKNRPQNAKGQKHGKEGGKPHNGNQQPENRPQKDQKPQNRNQRPKNGQKRENPQNQQRNTPQGNTKPQQKKED